jgi:hypothetical protein
MKLLILQSSTLLQPPATSSPRGPNILLNTLFSNTFNLDSFWSIRDHVSPIQKTGKIIVLYVIIFKFLEMREEDKKLNRVVESIP